MLSALPPKADFPILELLPPSTFRECHHGGLARRLVAVRRGAVLVVAESERPHPGRTDWRGVDLEDAADRKPGDHVRSSGLTTASPPAEKATTCQ